MVYYILGALVFTNLGGIGTIVLVLMKAVWWASKTDSRVFNAEKTSIRAHKRIDDIIGIKN